MEQGVYARIGEQGTESETEHVPEVNDMARRSNVVSISSTVDSPPKLPGNDELLSLRCTEMRRVGNSVDYVKHEKENYRAIVKELPEGINLLELNADNLESMVFDPMRERGLKANTINGRIKTARRLFAIAMRKGFTNSNPALDVVLSVRKKEGIPSLDTRQIYVLLQQPNLKTFVGLRDHCAMALMLDTGIRLREMLDLRTTQVNLQERLLKSVKGKNRKIQDVPLSEPMCDVLKKYLKERGQVNCEALFLTVDDKPLRRRSFQERMEMYRQTAEFNGVRVSPHTLRHTFAKHWIISGGDAISLRDMLRQSTMDQAAEYVMFFSTEIRDLHDKYSPLVNLDIL